MPTNPYPPIDDFEPGQLLDARRMQALFELVKSLRISVEPPLGSRVTPAGTELYWIGQPWVGIGTTSGTITARSGDTPGSGSVQPYYFNGTTLVSNGATITVENFTGSSISTSGTWVIYIKMFGAWWIIAADCAGDS